MNGSLVQYRSLARVGYATKPSLGADSVNIIIFTSISTGFVKGEQKVFSSFFQRV